MSESANEACTSALSLGMERNFSCAFNLNAIPVPLINLMSHSDGNPANNIPKKEARATAMINVVTA